MSTMTDTVAPATRVIPEEAAKLRAPDVPPDPKVRVSQAGWRHQGENADLVAHRQPRFTTSGRMA